MQLMRHKLNVGRNVIGQLPELLQLFLLGRIPIRGCGLLAFLDSVRQQRQPLVDVVMQLARNALSLRLLGMDEPAAEFESGSSCFLLVADVKAIAHVSGKRPVLQESGYTLIEHPAVLAIVPPQTVLAGEFLLLVKGIGVSLKVSM